MRSILITIMLVLVLSVAYADTAYEIRAVDFPGGAGTFIFAVNNLGQFVGAETDNTGANHAIFDTGVRGQRLPADPGWAVCLDHGSGISAAADILQHNFLKSSDDFHPFDLPARFGAAFVSAQTVNDLDEIVGYYQDASNVAHGFVAIRGNH